MNHLALTFLQCVDYSRFDEITVEIELAAGASTAAIEAKLDTGSKFCVFQPDHARLLGIDLESGTPERIRTATGSFPAYGHEVTLQVGDLQWNTAVYPYFAEREVTPSYRKQSIVIGCAAGVLDSGAVGDEGRSDGRFAV